MRVVYASSTQDKGTIVIRTRSLMQILGTLSAGVQVQPEHLQDGSALDIASSSQLADFTVYSGKEKALEAYIVVPYEGVWFWIDRRDYASKSTLSAVTVLFNFLEGGGSKVSPVLTIPTQ